MLPEFVPWGGGGAGSPRILAVLQQNLPDPGRLRTQDLTTNFKDEHLISPYNITPQSHIKVMREMINNWRSFQLLQRFSLSAA